MPRYIVHCTNFLYEDSYMDGEVGLVRCYDDKFEVDAGDVLTAISAYYDQYTPRHSYFDISAPNVEVFDNMVHDSLLLNLEEDTATESDIEQWKRGEINLYTRMMTIAVDKAEYTEVDLEEELKNISEKV